jgi:hypothetical protein
VFEEIVGVGSVGVVVLVLVRLEAVGSLFVTLNCEGKKGAFNTKFCD